MPQHAIRFFTEQTTYSLRQKNAIRHWITQSLQQEHKSLKSLNIVFCSDEFLYEMNVSYLNHKTYTDIITFDYSEEETIEGELFISIDRLRENAKQYGNGLTNEVHRVIIHGVLHLAGYHDKKPKDKALMTEKEDFYLSLRAF